MFTKPNLDLEAANNTMGWIRYEELQWLATQAQKHIRIVDLGSFMGRSARAMADNTEGVVFAIDDFQGPRDMNTPSILKNGGLFELFMYFHNDLISTNKLIPVVTDHAEARIDVTPDMVFIDGSHQYEDVLRDIAMWASVLAPGGLLCGHDYTNFHGVHEAVGKLIENPKIVKGTSIWYTTL